MGRANRYLGARNRSTVRHIEGSPFGTLYPQKATKREVLANTSRFPKTFRRLLSFSKGDVWENKDEVVAGKETKAFHNPKTFGC